MKKLIKHKEEHQTKKKGLKIFLGVVISLLVVYLLLVIIQVPYTTTEKYSEKEPQNAQSCENRNYNYRWEWGDWKEDGNFISPTLKLTNLENKAGIWKVRFAFYDSNYFSSEDDNKGIKIASIDEANMYSKTVEVNIAPYETRETYIMTEKKNPSVLYWAKYDIIYPQYSDCKENIQYIDVEKSTEITRYCSALKKLFGEC